MNETSILANIQNLTRQLNGEMKAVHELGLKVSVFCRGTYLGSDQGEQLSVRVWRETEVLREPPSEPMSMLESVRMNSEG